MQSALPQKDLRIKMEAKDSRAKKSYGDSRSVSLVTDIVNDGIEKLWLKRFHRVPDKSGTEQIYFDLQHESLSALSEPTPVPVPLVVVTPSVPEVEHKGKIKTRATEFENYLRKSQIGAIPETRELLFDALEGMFSESCDNHQHMLLLDVFAEAGHRAQIKADADGYSAEKKWPVATKCILRLMLWSGVLISEKGVAIIDKIGCNSTRVAKLAPEFRRVCEGFIVLHIIRESGMISYDDDPYYIGMTLYRRGLGKAVSSDELKIKADQILTHLYEQGKIEMDHDRQIRVRPDEGTAA